MRADSPLVGTVLEAANYTSVAVSKGYICLHDIESPPGKRWAEALGGPDYFQNPATKASVAYIVDADSVVQTAPEDRWTWSTGSPGSKHGIHIEQAGYASFSRSQWLGLPDAINTSYTRPNGARATFTAQDAADMASQFQLLARLMGDICKRHGWDPIAAIRPELVREVQGANLGRHVRHRDITEWVGGTTHTDPGPYYPWLELLARVGQYLGGSPAPKPSTTTPTPSTPTPPTAPTPALIGDTEMLIVKTGGLIGLLTASGIRHVDSSAMLADLKAAKIPEIRVSTSWWNVNKAPGSPSAK